MCVYLWKGTTNNRTLNRIQTLNNGWEGGAAAGLRQKHYISNLITNGFAIYFYESRANLPLSDELEDLPLNGNNVELYMENLYMEFEIQ